MRSRHLLPFVLSVVLSAATAVAGDDLPEPTWPRNWTVTQHLVVAPAQARAIGDRLGAPIEALTNTLFDAGGVALKVNVVRAATEEGAGTLRAKFAAIHGDDLFSVRRGRHVAEIICANRLVARAARAFLRWEEPEVVTWRVDMRVAGIESVEDAMRWNPLFNVLGRHRDTPAGDGGDAAAALRDAADGFTFRDTVTPLHHATGGNVRWSADAGDRGVRVAGIPRREIRAEVPVRPFSGRPFIDGEDGPGWQSPTPAWPADAERVQAIVKSVLPDPDAVPRRERVERLLGWVHRNIRYSGMRAGSRYGTLQVLEQGFGHCWDQSDVLITLCRAAGVPARQVGGWLVGVSGHVWLEVQLDEPAWLPVDATASWLGVSEDYVPLWSSDDGPIPLVYWGAPSIERVPDAASGEAPPSDD